MMHVADQNGKSFFFGFLMALCKRGMLVGFGVLMVIVSILVRWWKLWGTAIAHTHETVNPNTAIEVVTGLITGSAVD